MSKNTSDIYNQFVLNVYALFVIILLIVIASNTSEIARTLKDIKARNCIESK